MLALNSLGGMTEGQQAVIGTAAAALTVVNADSAGTKKVRENGREWYLWGGKYHSVPIDFVLHRMNLHALITYWFVGSVHPSLLAVKDVKPFDFPAKKNMTKCTL